MVQARINRGQVEPQDPIPPAWDGQIVKLVPLTPEDENPNLEEQLAALHALGPMEFDPGEPQTIAAALAEMNRLSIEAMNDTTSHPLDEGYLLAHRPRADSNLTALMNTKGRSLHTAKST